MYTILKSGKIKTIDIKSKKDKEDDFIIDGCKTLEFSKNLYKDSNVPTISLELNFKYLGNIFGHKESLPSLDDYDMGRGSLVKHICRLGRPKKKFLREEKLTYPKSLVVKENVSDVTIKEEDLVTKSIEVPKLKRFLNKLKWWKKND